VEREGGGLSISRQCELLSVSRSSLYYVPAGISTENLAVMRHLDEAYTRWPFYGVRRMRVELSRRGILANPKRIRRLMRFMGLEAIYPKPRLARAGPLLPLLQS
jgi:putative transposase